MSETIKTIARPIITVMLVAGWIIMLCLKIEVPTEYVVVASAFLAEWTTERAIMRYREMK